LFGIRVKLFQIIGHPFINTLLNQLNISTGFIVIKLILVIARIDRIERLVVIVSTFNPLKLVVTAKNVDVYIGSDCVKCLLELGDKLFHKVGFLHCTEVVGSYD